MDGALATGNGTGRNAIRLEQFGRILSTWVVFSRGRKAEDLRRGAAKTEFRGLGVLYSSSRPAKGVL